MQWKKLDSCWLRSNGRQRRKASESRWLSASVAGKVRENLGAAKGNGRAKDTIEAGVFEEGERPEENTWR